MERNISPGAIPSSETTEVSGPLTHEVKDRLILGGKYRVPLAELVSKVVSSNPDEFASLKTSVKEKPDAREDFFDALRVDDWEKALNDEAHFQFSSKHRPLVETVLNGIDSELRYEARNFEELPDKRVEVQMKQNGFVVTDHGEGMDLDTALVKLLVPKLTGNLVDKTDVIGRFGVGFYSLLSYVHGKYDSVVVRTFDGNEGYRISLNRYFGDDPHLQGKLCVVISQLSEKDQQRLGRGTEIEINSRNFDTTSAKAYLKDAVQFKQEADIVVDKEKINDAAQFSTLELSLPNNAGEKKRNVRILESPSKGEEGKVLLAVGGVKVEEFSVKGYQVPEQLVLDLPPNTSLPKSRDMVEVNHSTVQTIFNTIEGIFLQDTQTAARLWTTLAPVITKLQERNLSPKRSENLDVKLRESVKNWSENLPDGLHLFPNSEQLNRLAIEGIIPFDASYLQTKVEYSDLEESKEFVSTNAQFYWVPFKTDDVLAVTPGVIFGNEKYKTDDPRKLGMFNALFEVTNHASAKDAVWISGKFESRKTPIKREEVGNSPGMPPTTELASYGQNNQEGEESLPPRNPEMVVYENSFLKKREVGDQVDYDTETGQLKIEISDRYTPKTVDEFRHEWVNQLIYSFLYEHSVDDDQRWGNGFFVSDDPNFWQTIITDEFYDLVTEDAKREVTDEVILQKVKQMLPLSLLEKIDRESRNSAGLTFRGNFYHALKNDFTLNDIDKAQGIRAYMYLDFVSSLKTFNGLFGDDTVLQSLTASGEFADLANQIFSGEFDTGYDQRVGMQLLWQPNEFFTGGMLMKELSSLFELPSTSERLNFLRWFSNNNKRAIDRENACVAYGVIPDAYYQYDNANIYAYLYSRGIETEEDWDMVQSNFKLIEELAADEQTRDIFLQPTSEAKASYRAPAAESLLNGKIKKENIMSIKESVLAARLSEMPQASYVTEALAFAHMPPDVFSQVNEYLIRLYTEKDPSIFDKYSIFYDDFFTVCASRNRYGEWNVARDPSFLLSRDHLETPEQMLKRIELLSDYPAEYARAYNSLLSYLLNHKHGEKLEDKKEEYQAIDQRLNLMFQKLFELPQSESLDVVIGLMREFSKRDKNYRDGRDYVEERLQNLEDIPPGIRSWLLFLLGNIEIPRKELENFMEGLPSITVSGSDLVGGYLSSDSLTTVSNLDDLQQVYSLTQDRTRAKQLGQRRIEHAANYQNTQGYVWLRELVQNAFNATRDAEDKRVTIESFVAGPDFVISVEDPAGMDINTLVNALLIPQKSQWSSENSLGYFGQGFYTVFKEADQVRIKTSSGNGKTIYMELTPQRDFRSNKVMDLQIRIAEKDEQYQGTTIFWQKKTDLPEYETARVKDELTTYAGLLPERELQVLLNGDQINEEVHELTAVETDLGQLKIYKIGGKNSLTHHGLFVKNLDQDFENFIPKSIKDLLVDQGISIDLPASVHLIDSRNDIAQKEEILERLRPAIAEASVKAAAQLFAQGYVDLSLLPYDFFERIGSYSITNQSIRQDVQTLVSGEGEVDWTKYLQDNALVLQLLLSIPILEIDSAKVSLTDALITARDNDAVKEKLPPALQRILEDIPSQKEVFQANLPEFRQKGFVQLYDFSVEAVPVAYDAYVAFHELMRNLLDSAIKAELKDYVPTFYAKPDQSIAHFMPDENFIGWNLYGLDKNVQLLAKMIHGEEVSDHEKMAFYENLIRTGSHEYQHRKENREESLTHNSSFFEGQKTVLEQIIRGIRIDEMEAHLFSRYQGNYQPANELVRYLS